jgi:hypothetical protein
LSWREGEAGGVIRAGVAKHEVDKVWRLFKSWSAQLRVYFKWKQISQQLVYKTWIRIFKKWLNYQPPNQYLVLSLKPTLALTRLATMTNPRGYPFGTNCLYETLPSEIVSGSKEVFSENSK